MSWLRCRFKANLDDFRPVKWPPPGPFWGTGFNDEHYIVVAYVKRLKQVKEYWPEAEDIDSTEEDSISFTDRFIKPDWWKEGAP